jgi:hypothetical protein
MKALELLPIIAPSSGVHLREGLAYSDSVTRVDPGPGPRLHRAILAVRSPTQRLDDMCTRLGDMGFDVRWEVTMRAPFVASAKVARTTFRCEALTQDLAVHALLLALGEAP